MIDNSASMAATDVAAQPAGKGQGGGQEGRQRDGRRRPGDGDLVRRDGPGRLELHRRPRVPAAADRLDRADAVDDVAPRGASGGRRAGQSVEADRRGRGRLVGRHAQAVHLHRRRLRRRRGLQPGQPRARGRRDRPAAAALLAPAGRSAGARRTPRPRSATRPTTWRSSPFRPGATRTSPTSTSSSAASTTSAPSEVATEAQLYRHAADKPGDEGPAGRRDRAQASAPERPVVQVRPARQRADRPRGAAHGQGRPGGRQPRLRRRRQRPQGPGAGDHRRQPLPAPTHSRPRRPAEHADITIVDARGGQGRGASSRDIQGGRLRPGHLRRGQARDCHPRPMRFISASLPPGPAYAKPKDGRAAGDPRLGHLLTR